MKYSWCANADKETSYIRVYESSTDFMLQSLKGLKLDDLEKVQTKFRLFSFIHWEHIEFKKLINSFFATDRPLGA